MTLVKRDVGELLVDNGQISPDQLQEARAEQESTGESLVAVLARLGLADENQVKNALELEYGVNYVSLKKIAPVQELLSTVSAAMCRQYQAVPIWRDATGLTLAMVAPHEAAASAFRSQFGEVLIKTAVCLEDDLLDFLKRGYKNIEPTTESFMQSNAPEPRALPPDGPSVEAIEQSLESSTADDMAIVFLANHIVSNALTRGCTNIHIEPSDKQLFVHYRKDGVLFAARKLPRALLPLLVTRFKKMAEITSNERNVPLDGRLNVRISGKQLLFRLSIVPGAYGEHLVIWLD